MWLVADEIISILLYLYTNRMRNGILVAGASEKERERRGIKTKKTGTNRLHNAICFWKLTKIGVGRRKKLMDLLTSHLSRFTENWIVQFQSECRGKRRATPNTCGERKKWEEEKKKTNPITNFRYKFLNAQWWARAIMIFPFRIDATDHGYYNRILNHFNFSLSRSHSVCLMLEIALLITIIIIIVAVEHSGQAHRQFDMFRSEIKFGDWDEKKEKKIRVFRVLAVRLHRAYRRRTKNNEVIDLMMIYV